MKAYDSAADKEKNCPAPQGEQQPAPAIQCKGYAARTSYPLPPAQPKPNRTGLPDNLKAGIESLSGFSMNDVKVHYNSGKPAQLQALAYAQGTDIHVAPGQEKHLPHEAWHVVQQKQGRVLPMVQLTGGMSINDNQQLEKEADRMGRALVNACNTGSAFHEIPQRSSGTDRTVQKKSTVIQLTTKRKRDEAYSGSRKRLKEAREEDLAPMISSEPAEMDIKDSGEHLNKRKREEEDSGLRKRLKSTKEEEMPSLTIPEPADMDIEDLTEQFSGLNISVSFYSDIDQHKEEHQVYAEHGDIVVASNPKPLKLVLAAGKWGGYSFSSYQVKLLTVLRKAAKYALYDIAGNAKRNTVGSRTKANMKAFRNALESIANVLSNLNGIVHNTTLMPVTDLSKSVNYNNNKPPTEGKHLIAKRLSLKSATPGSSPKDGQLMTAIRKLAGPQQSKSYVQMHLLNDLVYGPGELWNLTPGPKKSNSDMESKVEDPLKRAVLGKGLVINFEAKVTYQNDPVNAKAKDIEQDPNKYRFDHIDFSAEQLEYNSITSRWKRATVQDADVKAVNGKRIPWTYGSLTPLVPKPRILDAATTWQELNAVGVQEAAAKRIVAFIGANKGWAPGSPKNKQQQLAAAVKKWDNKKTIPNITSWKGNAVLWT